MAGEEEEKDKSYGMFVGLLYIFNMIVGVGLLVMPGTFRMAGWLFASILITWIGFISWISASILIEAQACANKTKEVDKGNNNAEYNLEHRYDMNAMSYIFLPGKSKYIVPVAVIIEMCCELTIMSTVFGVSIANIFCQRCNDDESLSTCFNRKCNDDSSFKKASVYSISVAVFLVAIGSLSFFTVKSSMFVQFVCTAWRLCAFAYMLLYAFYHMIAYGPVTDSPVFDIKSTPALVGSVVYAYMCHPILPSVIEPIRNKEKIQPLMFSDFVLITAFYILLPITAVFSIRSIEALYSINFLPKSDSSVAYKIFGYFIGFYPAAAIVSIFPVAAISLQGNLKELFLDMDRHDEYSFFIRRILFPVIALIPPIIAVFEYDVQKVVAIAGNFSGMMVQHVVPVVLCYCARKVCSEKFPPYDNKYCCPLKQNIWLLIVLIWVSICLVFIIYRLAV